MISKNGELLGKGHNMRVQKGSAIHHVCSKSSPSNRSLTHRAGWDVRSRKFWASSRLRLQGGDHVHNVCSSSYILVCLLTELYSTLKTLSLWYVVSYTLNIVSFRFLQYRLGLTDLWTLSTGACLLYGISRVVIGENSTFLGGEQYLKQRGVEVINLESKQCQDLMELFIRENPDVSPRLVFTSLFTNSRSRHGTLKPLQL